MDFGSIPEGELDKVDLSLPHDPNENRKILFVSPVDNQKVYVGLAKWGRTEWVGKIYPPQTRERNFLQHYIHQYNSIELNLTHHQLYGARAIEGWRKATKGKNFVFCPKMYKGVTHNKGLKGKEFLARECIRGFQSFEDHLGPVFLQFSDRFSPNRKEELFKFMLSLPQGIQYFIEVRHPAWFRKDKVMEDFFDFLTSNKFGAVITDAAGRRDCVHMRLTVPKAFIRFIGNSLHPTDYLRIDSWVHRVKEWLDNGLQELYFFVHMHDETNTPELSDYLIDKLNQECGLNLLRPQFINDDAN